MMKAQKPKFVRGFGYLDCSLVSFGAVSEIEICTKLENAQFFFLHFQVIKASGTAFTLLQTAKEKF